MNLRGSNILVMGMGKSGQAAAQLALARGARHVACVDANPNAPVIEGTRFHYGPHRLDDFTGGPDGFWDDERPHCIVLSPGIPPRIPILNAARKSNIPIVGEIDFAVSQCPETIRFIGITGTNGKSSTAWFTHQLLQQAGIASYLGGNIGFPLSNLPLDQGEASNIEVAVVELSSYQLESIDSFHAKAGVILNLTPDHLARHGTMESYGAAKLRLFENMTNEDVAILPLDTPTLPPEPLQEGDNRPRLLRIGTAPGLVLSENELELTGTDDDGTLSLEDFPLPGEHNRINAGVAAILAISVGAKRDRLDLSKLEALAHRMEIVYRDHGVVWINDSKATNVESTLAAIEGVPSPTIILLGGQGKNGANYELLRPGLAASASAIICFGASAPEIASALDGLPIHEVGEMKEAVQLARDISRPGDSVLLSPACASFDAFGNFEERGRMFSQLARGEHR